MSKSYEEAIHARRQSLRNPYAYVDELEEMDELRSDRRKLQNPFAHADEVSALSEPISQFDSLPVNPSPKLHRRADRAAVSVQSGAPQERGERVEALVREQHRQIWVNRENLFADYQTRSPIDMIDPIAGLELQGYQVEIHGALGQMASSDRHASRVAGLIDKESRKVLLSSGFPLSIRNFTAAHELGHAVMHEIRGMHRDRPLDGSLFSRDAIEQEADRFAAMYLMPRKLLRQAFEARFGKVPFMLNEETRFALAGSIPHERWQPKSTRALSRLLSSATRFNGMSFTPLSKLFRVSDQAMAIRLEELQLVSSIHV